MILQGGRIANMQWWIISLISIVLMLAMLAIAPDVNLPLLTNILNGFLSVSILVSSLALWLLAIFIDRKWYSQHSLPNFLYLQLPKVLKFFAVLLMLLTASLQAIIAIQQAQKNELKQPQRVVATVKIEGISDSIYQQKNDTNKAAPMGYRQIVTIVEAKPLLVNVNNKSNKNSYVNAMTNNDELTINSLTAKRVLISAYPTLTNKKHHPNFKKLNELAPNQLVKLTLELKKIPANKQAVNTVNTQKFNEHRWLRARHIDAQAKILAINELNLKTTDKADNGALKLLTYRLNQMRFNLRQHFLIGWSQLDEAEQQAKAVTLSLLTGDRALINKATKDLYQLTGISHLLAISGTHVLFLAILASMLAIAFINRFVASLYFIVPRWLVRWLIMIIVAAVYAMFTGFDVPAARTFWMLFAVGVTRLLFMRISSYQILLLVAMIMAWIDPFVLWQAGFWLSFVAVGLLISFDGGNGRDKIYKPTIGLSASNKQVTVFTGFLKLIKVQLWMFVTLLPLSLLLFGKVSWWGILVNVFAIGLYGWVIVPINLLAGLAFLLSPTIAEKIWQLLNHILLTLHSFLNDILIGDISNAADVWIYTQVNAGIILIAVLAMLPWLMPKGVINRLLSLPPVFLLMFVLYNQTNITQQQPKLSILQTKDAYITAQVLQTHTDNWLIVADHLPANHHYKRRLTEINIMANLQAQLGVLGVSHLTGIIVQSPSQLLGDASQILASQMPVAQIWQAGINELNTNTANDRLIEPLPCTADTKWRSDDNSLTIKAITGWQNINNTAMHNCSLLINSNKLIEVVSQFDSAWANLTTRNADLPFNNKTNSIMIDIATDKKLWQVWELLCKNDSNFLPQISNNQNKPIKRMWLLHSSSQVDAAIVNKWQVDSAIISDEINKYNQLKSKQKLLELTHLQE